MASKASRLKATLNPEVHPVTIGLMVCENVIAVPGVTIAVRVNFGFH